MALPVDPGRYAGFLLATWPGLVAAPVAGGRFGCLDAALAAAPRAGLGIELGVYRGRSLRRMARRQPWRDFHGFDSLTGFPPDGRPDWRQDFALPAPPRLPGNCTFHEGHFAQTVPRFVAASSDPVALLNIDCDIASSAWEGLSGLAPRLGPGAAIHLDEALNYDTWLWNEMLALFRFLDAASLDIRWIARGDRLRDLPATLRFLEAGRYPTWEDDVAVGYARQAAGLLVPRTTPWPSVPAELADRFARLSAAYYEGTQARVDCHPDDPAAPPPARNRWNRWWTRWVRR